MINLVNRREWDLSLIPNAAKYATKDKFNFNDVTEAKPSLSPFKNYARSKLAIVMMTKALSKKYPELNIYCYHPGATKTAHLPSYVQKHPKFNKYIYSFRKAQRLLLDLNSQVQQLTVN